MDQAALIDSVGSLKQAVPSTVSVPCDIPVYHGSVPPLPSDILAFSIRQEQARICERGRKDEAVGIVNRTNAAVDALMKALRDAVTSSKIKTGPWEIW